MSLLAPEDPQRQQQERARKIAADVYDQLVNMANHGTNLSALGPTTDVARTMVGRLATAKNPWADIVGPCYTSGALQRELGVSRAAVSKAVKELRILRVTTSDGVNLYPAFQIHGNAIVPGLDRVLRVLAVGTNSTWTWGQWLNGAGNDDDGTPLSRNIDRLIAGDIEGVVRDAEHDAAAWAA
ncbi:hypothetical protein [Microbacterium sp. NPDC055665]